MDNKSGDGRWSVSRADLLALLVMAIAILGFTHEYWNPFRSGLPVGIDLGNDLAFLGTLRSELLDSGRLLTWWSVAYDGIPLIGHPNTQFFYAPLVLPSLAFGTETGVRIAYVFSMLLAGSGMYALARALGPRPAIAAWAGLIFTMSGGLIARVHAGHLQKVLAMPYIPLVLVCALLAGRARTLLGVAFWGALAGLLHGFTFLAGESFLQVYLLGGVTIILLFGARNSQYIKAHHRLLVGLGAWVVGMAVATSGKLIASIVVLADTVREVDPFIGGQHVYWAFAHLVFPFFAAVRGLESFSYGPNQVQWTWGWWEYTQYISLGPVALAVVAVVLVVFRLGKCPGSAVSSVRRWEVLALVGVGVLGAFWLANEQWYSPVRWLYEVVTPLQNFRVPSRAMMLAAPAVLALSAVGMDAVWTADSPRKQTAALVVLATALGATWWFNASWFTPFQWVCDYIPGLDIAPFPVCIGLLIIVAATGLGAAGLMFRRLSGEHRQRAYLAALALAAALVLGDVYHATRAIPRVEETSYTASVRKVIDQLQILDPGPFLVGLGTNNKGFGMYINKAIRFEFAEKGVAVAENVTPLVPEQQNQHQVLNLEQRMRYRVVPASPELEAPQGWDRLLEEGNVVVLINNQAQGDAWLIYDDVVEPLKISDSRPGEFTVRTSAPEGATLVVPANAFRGWQVSIDGGPDRSAGEFDGFAAVTTKIGEHTYKLAYKQPLLPLILVLGALPWLVAVALLAASVYCATRRHNPGVN